LSFDTPALALNVAEIIGWCCAGYLSLNFDSSMAISHSLIAYITVDSFKLHPRKTNFPSRFRIMQNQGPPISVPTKNALSLSTCTLQAKCVQNAREDTITLKICIYSHLSLFSVPFLFLSLIIPQRIPFAGASMLERYRPHVHLLCFYHFGCLSRHYNDVKLKILLMLKIQDKIYIFSL
jgi:hypothetical protein